MLSTKGRVLLMRLGKRKTPKTPKFKKAGTKATKVSIDTKT